MPNMQRTFDGKLLRGSFVSKCVPFYILMCPKHHNGYELRGLEKGDVGTLKRTGHYQRTPKGRGTR
jgi:hypothetical protein